MKLEGKMNKESVPDCSFDLIRGEKEGLVRIRLYELQVDEDPLETLPQPGAEEGVEDVADMDSVNFIAYDIWEYDQDGLFDYVCAHFDWYMDRARQVHEEEERIKAAKAGLAYLKATDYRVIKAVEKVPEIAAIIEELYPGSIGERESFRDEARMVK